MMIMMKRSIISLHLNNELKSKPSSTSNVEKYSPPYNMSLLLSDHDDHDQMMMMNLVSPSDKNFHLRDNYCGVVTLDHSLLWLTFLPLPPLPPFFPVSR